MSKNEPYILLLVVILLVWLAACVPAGSQSNSATSPSVEDSFAESTPIEAETNIPPQTPRLELPDLGPAPELMNETWLNTGQALRLSDLRGQVVLLDMWTYG